MQTYRIALVPGDGIGQEVVPAGVEVLRAASEVTGSFALQMVDFDWGCAYYLRNGRMMPEDALDQLAQFDAIYLGAVGYPGVPDHVSLWGLLLPIRQAFQQYINLRPIRLLPGVQGPLRDKGPAEIDFVCVRENTEGEYSGHGGRSHVGTPYEVATQVTVFTRTGVERVLRFGFELARKRAQVRGGHARTAHQLISCTKSNAQQHVSVMWDDVCKQLAATYDDVTWRSMLVDALAAEMVLHPERLDVVVGSNLFGDILTDLGGALQGSLGMPASANIDPSRRFPSLFEPVHGSAPDIAGKGIANPVATIWAGAMMLEHLGQDEAAALVTSATERVIAAGQVRTPDLGGSSSTTEVAQAIAARMMSEER